MNKFLNVSGHGKKKDPPPTSVPQPGDQTEPTPMKKASE